MLDSDFSYILWLGMVFTEFTKILGSIKVTEKTESLSKEVNVVMYNVMLVLALLYGGNVVYGVLTKKNAIKLLEFNYFIGITYICS